MKEKPEPLLHVKEYVTKLWHGTLANPGNDEVAGRHSILWFTYANVKSNMKNIFRWNKIKLLGLIHTYTHTITLVKIYLVSEQGTLINFSTQTSNAIEKLYKIY